MKNKIDLFIDSGAYSAKTQGAEINIKKYIKFIKKYKHLITIYANLDVIGDPVKSWENQMEMEKAGLTPIPCFHYGEDIKWLKKYLARNYDIIALGGTVGQPRNILIYWYDNLFSNYFCDYKGMPKYKVHAFGQTSLKIILRYPWYSVDSTSWVMTGRMGAVYVPRFKNGKWIYNENSWKVNVSNRSPSQKDKGQHYSTFSPMQKEMILSYINEKGFQIGESKFRVVSDKYKPKKNERWSGKAKNGEREVERMIKRGLCNDYKLRDELNIIYFLDLEKSITPWPWPFKKGGVGGLF